MILESNGIINSGIVDVGNNILEVIEEEEKEFSLVSSLKSEDSNGAVFRGEKLHDMKF